MRILIVSADAHPCDGGVDTYVRSLVAELRARGYSTDFLHYNHTRLLPAERQEDINAHLQKLARSVGKMGALRAMMEREYVFQHLLAMVDYSAYDIIHTNSGIASGAVRKLSAGIPLVGTVHGCFYSEFLARAAPTAENGQEAELIRQYDWYATTCPDKTITVANFLDPNLPAFPAEKRVVIFNGIDVKLFRPGVADRTGPVRIAASGYLERRKGYDVLLRALKLLADKKYDYEITIYGSGTEADGLKAYAAANELPVAFPGYIARPRLARELRKADIFVQPSRLEPFGLSVTEAMASACAPVCSRVGGLTDQVRHLENGLLFASEDEGGLAEALATLMDDDALRHRLARKARETAVNEFSLGAMVGKLEKVYQEIAGGGK